MADESASPFRGIHFSEITEATMLDEPALRRLAAACRASNVRLIPLINCLGHQSSAGLKQIHGMLRAYPQFNETPCKPDALSCNWCPSDPRIPPVAIDLIDELLAACESDAIHLGMDEVLELGWCEFCRSRTPGELFAKAVNELHAHVVRTRKVEMTIWADCSAPGCLDSELSVIKRQLRRQGTPVEPAAVV